MGGPVSFFAQQRSFPASQKGAPLRMPQQAGFKDYFCTKNHAFHEFCAEDETLFLRMIFR